MSSPEIVHQGLVDAHDKLRQAVTLAAKAVGLLVESQVVMNAVSAGTGDAEMQNVTATQQQALHDIQEQAGNVSTIPGLLSNYSTEKLGMQVMANISVEFPSPPAPIDPQRYYLDPAERTPEAVAARRAAYLQNAVDQLGVDRYEPADAYVVTNDQNLGAALQQAYTQVPDTTDTLRVGIIVGSGAILSCAPELAAADGANLDAVVMVDQNGFMMDWLDYSKEVLAASSSPKEYIENIWKPDHPVCQNAAQSYTPDIDPQISLHASLMLEIDSMGNQHFLSGQARYDECKAAVANLPQVEAVADLTSPNDVAVLGKGLRDMNATVPFANLTNVYEHSHAALDRPLSSLPFEPNAAIVYSSLAKPPQGEDGQWALSTDPVVQQTIGLPAYIEAAAVSDNQAMQMLNESQG